MAFISFVVWRIKFFILVQDKKTGITAWFPAVGIWVLNLADTTFTGAAVWCKMFYSDNSVQLNLFNLYQQLL